MKKRIITVLVLLALIAFASIGIANIRNNHQHIQLDQIKLQDNTAKLKLLNTKYQQLNTQLDKSGVDKAKLEEQLKTLEQEKQALQAQITARQLKTPSVSNVAYAQPVSDGGDAKMFIYNKESGNNPAAVNSSGCRGLGQACPGSKLPCSNTDYACQDAFFTNYMASRYGTWENAKAFWLGHSWW